MILKKSILRSTCPLNWKCFIYTLSLRLPAESTGCGDIRSGLKRFDDCNDNGDDLSIFYCHCERSEAILKNKRSKSYP